MSGLVSVFTCTFLLKELAYSDGIYLSGPGIHINGVRSLQQVVFEWVTSCSALIPLENIIIARFTL